MFQTKKINSETLSEYLLDIRTSLKFSLPEVAEKTAIPERFLEMLESGKFTDLPPVIYVCGFLKQLASLYGINRDVLLKQYKKEAGIAERVQIKTSKERKSLPSLFSLTPKRLSFFLLLVFVLFTAGYVAYEIRMINRTPTITIHSPASGSHVSGSFVLVAGKTEPGNQLTINNKNVFVKDTGEFSTTISVSSGQTTLNVVAKNKFDKVVEKSISVVATIGSQEVETNPIPAPVTLGIEALEDITVALSVDGNNLPPETMSKGQVKHIGAERELLLSTTDAGHTRVVFNNQKLGTLGKVGESLKDVPFTLGGSTVLFTTKPNKD